MADLIEEFFKRDLSESEAEDLGKLLQESPDAPLRFKALSEQRYLAMGLPAPQLPDGVHLPSAPRGLGLSGWIAGIVLTALVITASLWKFWPHAPVEANVKTIPVHLPPSAVTASVPEKATKAKALPPSSIQPVPAAPAAEGMELSVSVDTRTRVLATVRVLDASGHEVRSLFTGFIQPGQWTFKWDGDLAGGQPAPAGQYKIDVQTGDSHQLKEIQIQ
jgi:hypothetical protein